MIGMRPLVYQSRSCHSPSLIITGIACLVVMLWVNWLGDILANFLFAESDQNGNKQGGQEKKKEGKNGKKNPPAPNKNKSKGNRKSDIDTGQ